MLIRDIDRLEIIKIAKQTIKTPSKILAFGSRVNGDAHDTSDLDLVIVPNKNHIKIDEFIAFKEALSDSNIPILIQVLDWNRIPKSFHNNILKKYEILVDLV